MSSRVSGKRAAAATEAPRTAPSSTAHVDYEVELDKVMRQMQDDDYDDMEEDDAAIVRGMPKISTLKSGAKSGLVAGKMNAKPAAKSVAKSGVVKKAGKVPVSVDDAASKALERELRNAIDRE
eukprot:GILK01009359.1.p1 GENE.GILK01009359.1~~GILK01009359.1.p1  ORF type:complete len:136 (-),score=24.65 GILK01009359.1:252-620(-)